MTIEFMRDLLSKDEKITVEYKTCQHGVQEDVYETVCSFSNRYGGYIIMGAKDDGTPIGINRNMVKDMKKNFVNQLNTFLRKINKYSCEKSFRRFDRTVVISG